MKKQNNVVIEVSLDRKKWTKVGVFLNEKKAYASLAWENAQKHKQFCRIKPA